MQSIELIGAVAAEIIRENLTSEDNHDGVARFLLDQLTPSQVAAICRQILDSPQLNALCEIHVPRQLLEGTDLPEEIMSDEKTTHYRHASCSKAALILANTNDDQAESLGELVRIGTTELKARCDIWVKVASVGAVMPAEHANYWKKALIGCQKAIESSLDQFADYISKTRLKVCNEHEPLSMALGWALPALRLPRDSGYFESIPDKNRGQIAKWQRLYEQAVSKRRCLLYKETTTRKTIEQSELLTAFDRIKDQIPPERHELVQAFINGPTGWNVESASLSELEWEIDNIGSLFSGLRTKKLDLAAGTVRLFQDEYPNTLSETEIQFLELLKNKPTKEATDDDVEFYEKYRQELDQDKPLKAMWDKLVYGQPIECTDFLVGIVQCVERLRDQLDQLSEQREIHIRAQKGSRRSKWLELNADVGLFFSTRYRGLPKLFGPKVKWDTPFLFEYRELLQSEQERKKSKYKKNTSIARAAIEIKFFVECKEGAKVVSQTQLIWKCNPNAIGMELYDDVSRLLRSSTVRLTEVYREISSKKGRLQGLSLDDVGTLAAAFKQGRGSLVGKYDKQRDLAVLIPNRLKEAQKANRILPEKIEKIEQAWTIFCDKYSTALTDWLAGQGIASPSFLEQADAYQELLTALLENAPGDTNRTELIEPVLALGCTSVKGGNCTSIVAPWNPLKLASIAVKARQVSGLVRHILTSENVDFGDSRVFFSDIRQELLHCYYPEVCLGYKNQMAELLAASYCTNDYILMERPIRDRNDASTHEDPSESAERIALLVQRYLELMPHEKANLSIALYNCDSIRLPQAVVARLSEMLDNQQESRCQIVLRHSDARELSELYRHLLEVSDADPDALIASEVTRDFIARLRIGVKADSLPVHDASGGKFTDIVFLQDAISRRAQQNWEESPFSNDNPDLLDHVPPRWSYRKPGVRDDLKSTIYLSCPSQPQIGRVYLDALYSVLKGVEVSPGTSFIPVRQISFRDENTQKILKEVHELGEWVANLDDILERRQLANQKIRVIRYQQSRTDKSNFIVSSTSSLSLLHVLVKRRLLALNLDLDDAALNQLAERLIDDANELSGDIVLRAAKNGCFASELVGVCLSKALLKAELGKSDPMGWYFLDDYASWLGQKEGRIADIMVLSPKTCNGLTTLTVGVSESKYVDMTGIAEARKSSQKQLRETVDRINNALFLTPGRLDRDLWLSRIGDLLLTGLDIAPTHDLSIEQLRNDIRSGKVPIEIRGYSHVFVSGPSDAPVGISERNQISHADNCFQEIFGRDHVRKLMLAYHNRKDLLAVRSEFGDEKPWLKSNPKLPADRVNWAYRIDVQDEVTAPPTAPAAEKVALEFTNDEDENLDSDENISSAANESSVLNTAAEQPEKIDSAPVASQQPSSTSVYVEGWLGSSTESTGISETDTIWLKDVVSKLMLALRSYNLQSKVVRERLTPNAALITLKGSDRLTVEDIEKRSSPLLTTHGIEIISVIGQPGEILVSVTRPNRETISLKEIWKRRKLNRSATGVNMSFVVGVKEVDGELLYLNLASSFEGLQQHAPHTLIAGATGSGKSVLLQNLLLDICVTNDSDSAKIYLIDPKAGVDYSQIEDLPHLVHGIVVEQSRAIEILEYLVAEMDRRYLLFRELKVRDLPSYNSKVDAAIRLPVLFLVHDEFAEWMLIDDYKAAVSSAVQRLSVKARAAGIHLIFAAQRPDANVLPVQLRDNLGNRLILRVESVGTSEIALGVKGAEKLLGKGHLAARLLGESDIIYAQVPYLQESDLEALVDEFKKLSTVPTT